MIFPTLSNSLQPSQLPCTNASLTLFSFHTHTHSLSLSLSLFLPTPTASRLPFKSNSDLIFPMPLVMNHGLGFQDSTRLHLSKSKSNFLYSSLLGSDSRFSTLISLSYKLVLSKCSLFSLLSSLSSDFKISLFYFETNKSHYSFTSKSF